MTFQSDVFKLKDGTRCIVEIGMKETYDAEKERHGVEYKINDIKYKEPKMKIWRSYSNEIKVNDSDCPKGRYGTMDDGKKYDEIMQAQRDYIFDKFIDFVGEANLEYALQNVYEQMKPTLKITRRKWEEYNDGEREKEKMPPTPEDIEAHKKWRKEHGYDKKKEEEPRHPVIDDYDYDYDR